MRTTIVYRENKLTGELEKTEIKGGRTYTPSYDSHVDLPLHQRVLNGYRDLEASGKLRDSDCPGGKAYTKRVHERALAREV